MTRVFVCVQCNVQVSFSGEIQTDDLLFNITLNIMGVWRNVDICDIQQRRRDTCSCIAYSIISYLFQRIVSFF